MRDLGGYHSLSSNEDLEDRLLREMQLLMMSPKGWDRDGRLYFQGPLANFVAKRSYDSIPLYRVHRNVAARPLLVAPAFEGSC